MISSHLVLTTFMPGLLGTLAYTPIFLKNFISVALALMTMSRFKFRPLRSSTNSQSS